MAEPNNILLERFYHLVSKRIKPYFKQYTDKFLDQQLISLGKTREDLSYSDKDKLANIVEINSRPIFGVEKSVQLKKIVLETCKDLIYLLSENQVSDAKSIIENKLRIIGVTNMLIMTDAQKIEFLNSIQQTLNKVVSINKAYALQADIVRTLDIRQKYY